MTPRTRAYIYLILVAAIWGSAAAVIKFTLKGLDPLSFLAYRFSISALISFLMFAFFGIRLKVVKKHIKAIILYGVLAIPLALGTLFWGLKNASVLDLTLVGSISPLMVTAGGALFFHDHITKREKLGILIVLFGVFLNAFYPIIFNDSQARFTGNILLFVYLLADTGSILIAKREVRHKIKSITLTNIAFIIGAVVFIPITLLVHGLGKTLSIIVNLPLQYHLGVLFMSIFSGTLAYYLYIRAQKTIEVSEAVLFFYLQPLFSIPLAVFWLKESISLSFIIGAMIILLGLIIAEYKKGYFNSKPLKKI